MIILRRYCGGAGIEQSFYERLICRARIGGSQVVTRGFGDSARKLADILARRFSGELRANEEGLATHPAVAIQALVGRSSLWREQKVQQAQDTKRLLLRRHPGGRRPSAHSPLRASCGLGFYSALKPNLHNAP